MISFNSLPIGTRTPGQYIEFDGSRATNGTLPGRRILLVGQRLAEGRAVSLAIQPIATADDASAQFGRGSMLAEMADAFKRADRQVELHAIGLAEADGTVQATASIIYAGAATSIGTISMLIGGVKVAVAVPKGQTAADIAAAMGAAITARPDLPVTAVVAAGTVTLTARQGGSAGNDISLRKGYFVGERRPNGVNAGVVEFQGGVGDPDYGAIWPVIGDAAYDGIVIGAASADAIGAMVEELNDRWGPERMLETVCYAAKPGTQGTLAAFGAALNSELVSVMGIGSMPTAPWRAAAVYAAVVGRYGEFDPARPFQTLSLPGLLPPIETERFTRDERELLLKDGISTFTVDQGGVVRIERAITTYQLNAQEVADTAFLDLNSVLTLGYLRQSLRARIAAKYPRHKLADDDTAFGPGQAVVTPKILRAEMIALAREDWEPKGFVERIDQFKDQLIVQRNADDPNRIDALVPPDLVNQFRQFAAQIQFRL